MPEYLAPGVFVEEVSFRSRSIEGVATSTTGFVGAAHYGPVCFTGGPTTCEPRLLTSFTEFERVYGGLEPLDFQGTEHTPFLAYASKAFFDNGGKRLYVSRVFNRLADDNRGIASRTVAANGITATWRARWPGDDGNVLVTVGPVRSRNIAFNSPNNGIQARGVSRGSVVEIVELLAPGDSPPATNDPVNLADLRVVEVDQDGVQTFEDENGAAFALNANHVIQRIQLRVTVEVNAEREDVHDELGSDPRQRRYIGSILGQHDPEDQDAVVWLDFEPANAYDAARLVVTLINNPAPRLAGGNDGAIPTAAVIEGQQADPDNAAVRATGLEALAEVEDIAIVASPDIASLGNEAETVLATQALIAHAEDLRYRIAIVDPPEGSSLNQVRDFRGQFDSIYAALYYPWIVTVNPTQRTSQGAPPALLALPPSGSVAGIYARTDITRGVHKAPANEIVRGLTRFELNVNTPRQEVLNPEGINALRFFEGRGNRVWGARTMTSDPEWKYVNVRRLFNFMKRSIDVGTQFAVFEPNGPRLWANIRQAIEDFLLVLWRDGALLGDTPEQAYFVRCDRTTMTQNDIDNGRLICLIGVAPTKPAEFVIFRIGQWTSDASN